MIIISSYYLLIKEGSHVCEPAGGLFECEQRRNGGMVDPDFTYFTTCGLDLGNRVFVTVQSLTGDNQDHCVCIHSYLYPLWSILSLGHRVSGTSWVSWAACVCRRGFMTFRAALVYLNNRDMGRMWRTPSESLQ